MPNPIEKLYESDMDRREFVTHVGAGLMAIAGISGIVKALKPAAPAAQQPSAPARSVSQRPENTGSGYGSGAYGR